MRGSSQAAPDEGSCAPIHTAKKGHVENAPGYLPGLRVLTIARTRSRTSSDQACPPLHPGAVSPSQPPAHTARACTARGRHPPGRGPLLPLLPRPSSPNPSSSLWLTLRWPQSRKPRRRVLEKRYKRPWDADKVPAAESSGRVAAAQEEENAELAGPTDALTIPQFALPPRKELAAPHR